MKTAIATQSSIKLVAIVAFLSASGFIATDLYLPSFPSLVQFYHVKPSTIQLSLSLFILTFSISQFVSGLYSDRFGRKPVLLAGVSIFILGSALLFLTSSVVWLDLARAIQGLGIGAAVSIARILIRDLYEGKKLAKIFSSIASIIVLTPAIAPYIGGILQEYFNFYGSFVVMLICGIVLLATIKYLLPETNLSLNHDAIKLNYLSKKLSEILKHSRFLPLVLINGLTFSLVLTYSTISPFIFQTHYGFSPYEYGELILIIAGGLVVGTLMNYFLLNYFHPKKIVIFSLSVSGLVTVSLLIATLLKTINPGILVFELFLLNITVGLTLPNVATMIFNLFGSAIGLVGAVYGALRMLIAAIIGIIISSLHLVTTEQLTIFLVIINLLSLTCYGLLRFRRSVSR